MLGHPTLLAADLSDLERVLAEGNADRWWAAATAAAAATAPCAPSFEVQPGSVYSQPGSLAVTYYISRVC